MKKLMEWIAKCFGQIEATGLEAMAIKGLQVLLLLLVVYVVSKMLQRVVVRKIAPEWLADHQPEHLDSREPTPDFVGEVRMPL